jgi:hypothetical protein
MDTFFHKYLGLTGFVVKEGNPVAPKLPAKEPPFFIKNKA